LAKPLIQPIFVLPSSLLAIAPFLYLWNNPPSFVGKNVWLAFCNASYRFFRHRSRFVLPDDDLLEAVEIRLTHDLSVPALAQVDLFL
jgi:hypothetical protein